MRLVLRYVIVMLACYCALPSNGIAQTYVAAGGSIPDVGPVISFPINVYGLSPAVINSSFGLETICINITHTYDADLTVRLQAPDGTIVDLVAQQWWGR